MGVRSLKDEPLRGSMSVRCGLVVVLPRDELRELLVRAEVERSDDVRVDMA